ncbi:hypothetical protein ACWGLP_29335 [Streptomyces lydicus]
MTTPRWFSQPYPPEGASAAEGIRNQLGRPELDLLTILVRESAQNSWDARLDGSARPVEYRIDLRTVGPAHAPAWRELLLEGVPMVKDQLPLRESLRRGAVQLLAVSDRGTRGLSGPTRADDALGDERDFVSFVRNIGEPRDTALGGGTYGFGKGIFYLLSRAGSVLLHTRCRTPDGGFETRLIGCALWRSYIADGPDGERRYTGRHWWGDNSGEVIEPLIGAEADAVARRLGLEPFVDDETGTTVIVIDPILERDEEKLSPPEAADYLAEAIAWHLWPKMIAPQNGLPAMRFTVRCDGVYVPVPDPRERRPLALFVAAYEQMVGQDGRSLDCHRPKQHLGRLGLVKRVMPRLEPTQASRMVGIDTLVHHVCLMRPAELVVTYHAGPKPSSENQGYAGVFRSDTEMDGYYAQAEPPTHDAWNPHSLEYPGSTFVRTTFTRINEAVEGLLALGGTARAGAAKVALGAASSLFSGLAGGAWGIGGATAYAKPGIAATSLRRVTDEDEPAEDATTWDEAAPAKASRDGLLGAPTTQLFDADPPASSPLDGHGGAPAKLNGVRRLRPRVQYLGEPYYEDRADMTVLVQDFRLPVSIRQRVRVDLAVTLPGTGGRETDPPLGADMPTLIGWEDSQGLVHPEDACETEGGGGIWRALVRPAPDTMTEIGIKVEAVRPA